jgi:5-methylcytosine-specific restriction endonuclease McrA
MPMATKEEQRAYQLEWLKRRRLAAIEQFGGKCIKCGSEEDLEFDHIDKKTKVRKGDHAMWSWSEHRRNEELKKCQLLCEKCHIQKTIDERISDGRYTEPPHGTVSRYRSKIWGCKCSQCRAANTARMLRDKFLAKQRLLAA